MKKNQSIFVLSVLLLAMSACNEDEIGGQPVLSGEAIEFGAPSIHVEADTRGPVDQLPEGSSFGVLGYCLAQTAPDNATLNPASGSQVWSNKKQLCYPEVFYKKKVTYSGGSCSYEPLKKWYEPTNYNYSFFAYYPYEGAFTVTTEAQELGAPKVKFSIPFDSTEEATALEADDVPDAMVAQEIDVVRNTGQVQLNFLHILTGLNFQVNNYNAKENGDPGETVTIHSLKLYGTFYKSIEINFDSGYNFPNETFSGTYTIVPEGSDIKVPGLTSVSEIGNKTILMVSNLSQTTGTSAYLGDLKLGIEYSFNGKEHYTPDEPFTRPDNFLPAGGTIYTAQLNFIGNSFVLNFVVDNNQQWEDGGDSDITFE